MEPAEIIISVLGMIAALIGVILSLAGMALIIAMPLLIILAIYKAIKSLMTHNAELKRRNQDKNDRPY